MEEARPPIDRDRECPAAIMLGISRNRFLVDDGAATPNKRRLRAVAAAHEAVKRMPFE